MLNKTKILFIIGLLFIINNPIFADNLVYKKLIKSSSAAGYINQLAGSLADQLGQNKDFKNITSTPIAITSIVNLKNFKEVGKIGHIISENLIHEMQIRGYKVVDFKTMPTIEIKPAGDYSFSRDLKDLKADQNINYVLAGTYMQYSDGVSVNCRLIDIRTNIVKSSAQIFIPARVINKINYNNGFDIYPQK